MRILVVILFALMLDANAFAQSPLQPKTAPPPEATDPLDAYNSRLDACASCYGRCAHRWDQRRLSKELKRIGARARRECEERCAEFLKLGENECRGAYAGRSLGSD